MRRRPLAPAALACLATLSAGCGESEPVPIPDTCNGAEALCARRYDQVAYATTHNAMSSEEEGWVEPNQHFAVPRQLADGVRALMLDIHDWDGLPQLCHSICPLGSLPLVDGLARVREFLDDQRGEVVTLILESYVDAATVAGAFADAGLERYAFAPAPGAPWPTLRELIDDDQRLVVFTDEGGGAYPWYLDVWAHAWETPFSAETVDDFTCDPNRGDPGNALFILNHFLTRTFAVPDEAAATNDLALLQARAEACREASGALPNFVTVDFHDVGGLLDTVDALNGT
jgi:hypothetical protein